ncbi:MAG: acylase [Candidatus Hydrogenedens sp.]|nr:acylase [Candidatus Hydrogenedens sp.]
MIRLRTLACLAAVALVSGCPKAPMPPDSVLIPPDGKYDVEILRDEWGVPHVYGKTDADCAYGVAYAQCEDDYTTLEQGLFLARGKLTSLEGRSAVPLDYMVKMFRFREILDAKYETDLPADVRAIVEAYADGCNHFAALHPDKVADPSLLPTTGKDIVLGFMVKSPMFFGMDREARRLFEGNPLEVSEKHASSASEAGDTMAALPYEALRGPGLVTGDTEIGSNTLAVAPSRTPDGKTHLAINSHQPYSGPVAWYEVRIHSEEGWDMEGGVFPGTPVILHGHNPNLGWAHTVNSPDLVDIYKLEMNPENKNQYKFDGEWRDLEVKQLTIDFPLWGSIKIPVKREALYSVHGPAIRMGDDVYAIRYAGYGDIGQVEQWYRMNKATNKAEFLKALELQQIASFNIGYADKEGNIAYIYNAKFPKRAEGYDWEKYLPGNTSETLWTEYLPFSADPQVHNPESGYIYNCNGTPFLASAEADNLNPDDFSKTLGIETDQKNRGYRAFEQLDADDSITTEEFYQYKYDIAYSEKSDAMQLGQKLAELDAGGDPLIEKAQELIRSWDRVCSVDSTATAIVVLTLEPVVRGMVGKDDESLKKQLKLSAERLMQHYGTLEVPWGKINRLVRGDKNVALDGGPDILHAVYGMWNDEKGILEAVAGDCFIVMVEWDKDGNCSSRSIHQFGSATMDETSPHYADQVERFAAKDPKVVRMDRADLEQHLTAKYRPGEPRGLN